MTEREAKRVRFNVLDAEEKDEWGGDGGRMGANPPSSPTRPVLSPQHSGPTLRKISKRRESIVCTTDGGERRIVERWGDKETSQGLPQEGTASTKVQEVLGFAQRPEMPSAEGDLLQDMNGARGQKVEPQRSKRSACSFVVGPREASETYHRILLDCWGDPEQRGPAGTGRTAGSDPVPVSVP